MGVLQCYRRGCQNIMCNRYSVSYGCICNECFGELVKLGIGTNIKEFMMDTRKKSIDELEVTPYDVFNEEFPLR